MAFKNEYDHPTRSLCCGVLNLLRLRGMRRVKFIKCPRMLLAIFVIGTAFLPACSKGIDTVEWSEEVKLSDGSTIVIWRKARAKSSGFPDAKRGAYIDAELRYAPEGIHWKGNFGVYRSLTSFDRVNGVFYLVRIAETIQACATKKPEDYAIQILKWTNAQWVEIPQSHAPVDRIRMNLQEAPWGHDSEDDTKGLLRLDGQDDRPYSINRSARGDRTNPETIQSFYERTAIDPRTKRRAQDQDLFRWNLHLCGYWQRKIPVSVNPSREETLKRLEEAKKRFDASQNNNSSQER